MRKAPLQPDAPKTRHSNEKVRRGPEQTLLQGGHTANRHANSARGRRSGQRFPVSIGRIGTVCPCVLRVRRSPLPPVEIDS